MTGPSAAESLRRHGATLLVVTAVVGIAAAVRMPFWLAEAKAYGHGDAILWEVWSRAIHEHGFINVFRSADSNYVGYHYVLWPTSAIYARISPEYTLWTPSLRVLIKIPPFVCDLTLAVLIFFVARSLSTAPTKAGRDLRGAAAACAFALAPGIIYDSMWWSQIDSVNTLCMLGAVVLIARGRAGWGWAVWTAGFPVKPQPIVIVPALVAFTFWQFGLSAVLRGAAATAGVGLAALLPFLLHGDAARIGDTYGRLFEQDPIDLSSGAWNGWSILDLHGDPHPADAVFRLAGYGVSYQTLSLALSALATLIVLAYLRRHLDLPGLLVSCAVLVFAFYMLPTSTHERYLYPAFALAAPLLVRMPRLIPAYAVLASTFFLNLVAISPPSDSDVWQWHGTNVAVSIALINVGLLAAVLLWLLQGSGTVRLSEAAWPERALSPRS